MLRHMELLFFLHPLKCKLKKSFAELINTFFNEKHSLKAYLPIDTLDERIVNSDNDEQP